MARLCNSHNFYLGAFLHLKRVTDASNVSAVGFVLRDNGSIRRPVQALLQVATQNLLA